MEVNELRAAAELAPDAFEYLNEPDPVRRAAMHLQSFLAEGARCGIDVEQTLRRAGYVPEQTPFGWKV